MATLDELLKQSEIDKNQSEIAKNYAEGEKYKSDKNRSDLETKNLKTTFYVKPIIAGLILALGSIPIYTYIIKPTQEADIIEKNLQNKKLEKNLDELRDSLLNEKKQVLAISSAVESREKKIDSLQKITEQKKGYILWVDDIPANNATISNYIEKRGYNVQTSSSTQDALTLLKENVNKYNYIISDMGRTENGSYKSNAGEILLNKLLDLRFKNTIIFFSASGSQDESLKKRLAEKNIVVTNDYTKILDLLNLE